MSKFKNLLNSLNINEKYTKTVQKQKEFTHVKDNIPLVANYNFQCDLIYFPETKQKYKYLFTMTDLATNAFDCEPMKDRTAEDALKAMQQCFKRAYIKQPESSLQTDGGVEFKGLFNDWLKKHDIMHNTTVPDRHKQQGNIESLNKQLARLINGYLNNIEVKTGKVAKEWTPILPEIRKELNKIRLVKGKDPYTTEYEVPDFGVDKTVNKLDKKTGLTKQITETVFRNPKFNVGDVVIHKLETPHNSLGHKQSTVGWRVGDTRWDTKQPRKIVKIVYYSGGDSPYRFMLEGINNVSYTEKELMKAKNEVDNKYVIKQIIDKKIVNRKVFYKVWWRGFLKAQSTWEPIETLIEDDAQNLIDEYEELH